MSSLVQNLKDRQEQAIAVSKEMEAWLGHIAQDLSRKLAPYFAEKDRSHANGFYDLLLEPTIPCSREVPLRAAFYKTHPNFEALESVQHHLGTSLNKLHQEKCEKDKIFFDLHLQYQIGNSAFKKITRSGIDEWKEKSFLAWLKHILALRNLGVTDLQEEFREAYGVSLFEMPAIIKDAENAKANAQRQCDNFDHEIFSAVTKAVETAKHYINTAPDFIEKDIIPLFVNHAFIEQAKEHLDEKTFREVRDYCNHIAALSALTLVVRALDKVSRLNEADEELSSPDLVKRCRINFDAIDAYDRLSAILGLETVTAPGNIMGQSHKENISLGAAAIIQLQKLGKEAQEIQDGIQAQPRELQRETLFERLQDAGIGLSSGRVFDLA